MPVGVPPVDGVTTAVYVTVVPRNVDAGETVSAVVVEALPTTTVCEDDDALKLVVAPYDAEML